MSPSESYTFVILPIVLFSVIFYAWIISTISPIIGQKEV